MTCEEGGVSCDHSQPEHVIDEVRPCRGLVSSATEASDILDGDFPSACVPEENRAKYLAQLQWMHESEINPCHFKTLSV